MRYFSVTFTQHDAYLCVALALTKLLSYSRASGDITARRYTVSRSSGNSPTGHLSGHLGGIRASLLSATCASP